MGSRPTVLLPCTVGTVVVAFALVDGRVFLCVVVVEVAVGALFIFVALVVMVVVVNGRGRC